MWVFFTLGICYLAIHIVLAVYLLRDVFENKPVAINKILCTLFTLLIGIVLYSISLANSSTIARLFTS